MEVLTRHRLDRKVGPAKGALHDLDAFLEWFSCITFQADKDLLEVRAGSPDDNDMDSSDSI